MKFTKIRKVLPRDGPRQSLQIQRTQRTVLADPPRGERRAEVEADFARVIHDPRSLQPESKGNRIRSNRPFQQHELRIPTVKGRPRLVRIRRHGSTGGRKRRHHGFPRLRTKKARRILYTFCYRIYRVVRIVRRYLFIFRPPAARITELCRYRYSYELRVYHRASIITRFIIRFYNVV